MFIRFTSNWCKEGLLFDKELAKDLQLRQFLLKHMIPVTVDVTKYPHFFKLFSVGHFPDDVIRNVDGTFIISRQVLEYPSLKDFVGFAHQLYQEGRKYRHSIGNPDSRCFYQGVNDDTLIQLPSNLDTIKETIVELFLRQFDRIHGGFGSIPKYPNAAILETLFYLYHRSADEILLYQVILKTLSSMYIGLVDSKDHGFVRCAYRVDWGNPSPEKLLITQVDGIKTFYTAFQVTGNHAYLTAAKKTLDFVFNNLYSTSQGYFQAALTSVHPHTKVPTLKVLEEQDSSVIAPYDPLVDSIEVTSWNLQMIRCTLALGAYMERKEYSRCVLMLLEKYLKIHEKNGFLPHVQGESHDQFLLEDQVSFMEACKDAYDITLKEKYARAVFSMMSLLLEQDFDPTIKLFNPLLDSKIERHLKHEVWYGIEWNSRIANILYYFDETYKLLHHDNNNNPDYRELANLIVHSIKSKYRCFDPSLAHYFFAIQHSLQESIKIYLIGDGQNPKLQQFHDLIMKKYEPMRIIIHVPPRVLEEGSDLLPKTREIDKEPVMVYFKYQDVQSPPITTLRQLEIGLERIGMI